MSLKRCDFTSKICYNRKDAFGAAQFFRQKQFSNMNHYKCKKCGYWHIGNDRNHVALKRKRRKRW